MLPFGQEYRPRRLTDMMRPRETPFEPRQDGMEAMGDPRQVDFQPRPEFGEGMGGPRQVGFENRPSGPFDAPPMGDGGEMGHSPALGLGGMRRPYQEDHRGALDRFHNFTQFNPWNGSPMGRMAYGQPGMWNQGQEGFNQWQSPYNLRNLWGMG